MFGLPEAGTPVRIDGSGCRGRSMTAADFVVATFLAVIDRHYSRVRQIWRIPKNVSDPTSLFTCGRPDVVDAVRHGTLHIWFSGCSPGASEAAQRRSLLAAGERRLGAWRFLPVGQFRIKRNDVSVCH